MVEKIVVTKSDASADFFTSLSKWIYRPAGKFIEGDFRPAYPESGPALERLAHDRFLLWFITPGSNAPSALFVMPFRAELHENTVIIHGQIRIQWVISIVLPIWLIVLVTMIMTSTDDIGGRVFGLSLMLMTTAGVLFFGWRAFRKKARRFFQSLSQ